MSRLFDFFFARQKQKAFLDGSIYGQGKVLTEQREAKIAVMDAMIGKLIILSLIHI